MTKTLDVDQNQTINAFLLFYIITGSQIGVGIHGFQRLIYQQAKQDAWISIIVIFLLAHIVAFIMIKTLELYQTQDIYGIHQQVYGKLLGNFLNAIYVFYCMFGFFSIAINYVEVINTWLFPRINPLLLLLSLLLICIYAFTGGFRVIVGFSFFSLFFMLWIPPILYYTLEFTNVYYLLPVMEDFMGVLRGSYQMAFSVVGFEIINMVYPFIKEKEKKKAQKYVHLGLLGTLTLYLMLMLVALTYFSGEQLEKTIWATLTLFTIIKLPFIERIEIITICLWLVIIIPNLCLYMWASYRGIVRIKNISPRVFYLAFAISVLIGSVFINTRGEISMVNDLFGRIGFYLVFVYPFILYFLAIIRKKILAKSNR
nr:GerAB/ArcD/ProY family transporter [Lysinibacillus timonensis]